MAERSEASLLKRMIEEAQQSESKRVKIIMSNDEPEVSSPLGLKLTKSPSFLELIDTRLSRPTTVFVDNIGECKAQYASERLKAVNFPALSLQIGPWKRVASHESDIVGKCYFCKEKFVWEILSNGLKSKMEIPWQSISAIRASFAEKQPDTLEIELKMPPTFWLETNQQPRKHTIWKSSDDFTNGYARAYKRHFLMFKEGTLEKHYMNLLDFDARLYKLSRKPFPTDKFPFFDDFHADHKGMLMLQSYRKDRNMFELPQQCIQSMNLTHSFGSQTAMLQTMSMISPSLPREDITARQMPTITNMLNPAMKFLHMNADVSFPLAIDPTFSYIGNNCQVDSANAPMLASLPEEIPAWNLRFQDMANPFSKTEERSREQQVDKGLNPFAEMAQLMSEPGVPFYADDQSLLQTTSAFGSAMNVGGQVGMLEEFPLRNEDCTLGDPNLLMRPGVYNQVEEAPRLPESSTWLNGGNFRF